MANSPSKWLGLNAAAGAYQAVVGVIVIGILTALIGWLKGLQFHWAVLFGLAVTVGVAVAANLVSLIIVRHRKMHDPTVRGTSEVDVPVGCPYDWSHGIIETQRREIRSWIKVSHCALGDIDLFRQKPYMEFHFLVHNQSVYTVSLTKLGGAIDYANQPLSGLLQWVGAALTLLAGEANTGMIRLTLDDSDDIARMLNVNSGFGFSRFTAKVETEPITHPKDYAFETSLDDQRIRARYPKMDVEIKRALLEPYYDFDAPFLNWDETIKGVFVSVYCKFKNPRPSAATIEAFKLDTSPHVSRVTLATPGEIHQKTSRLHRGISKQNSLTPNLRDQIPIHAEQEVPFEGWLQFYLAEVNPASIENATPTLIIVGKSGEEHRYGIAALKTDKQAIDEAMNTQI